MMQNSQTQYDQLEKIKYPIGPLHIKDNYNRQELMVFTTKIANSPADYFDIAQGLNEVDLRKHYRAGSWNVRQLFHHVADIQMLHFLRMKKALTEDGEQNTVIILMDKWAETADGKESDIDDSLQMLDAITKRYVQLIRSIDDVQLLKKYFHPQRGYTISQAQAIAMSAWHLQHHLGHIKIAIESTQ